MKSISKLLIVPILLSANFAASQITSQDEESSRQIVLDRFNKARPLSEASGGMSSGSTAVKPPVYRRTGASRLARRGARPPATVEIGVTVWRLRPSRAN